MAKCLKKMLTMAKCQIMIKARNGKTPEKRQVKQMKVGSAIKNIRKSKGITATFVSKKIGVSHGTYSKYENNQRKIPVELLPPIANILGVEIQSFFEQKTGDTPES
jgi:DNA-binding XRE family transcriptional regulator